MKKIELAPLAPTHSPAFKRGDIVRFGKPVGRLDAEIAAIRHERCAAFIEYTQPTGFARIAFYGEAKGLTFTVHPESLERISRKDYVAIAPVGYEPSAWACCGEVGHAVYMLFAQPYGIQYYDKTIGEDEDDSPYCECGNEPIEEELASNSCFACGKVISP